MTVSFSYDDDIIDVRDLIERYTELRDIPFSDRDESDKSEILFLESILNDLRGNGGDEQFEGDWYPITLIRDTYFTEYAQELAEELDLVPNSYSWPTSYIDWERAARDLKMDYTSVEVDGFTYWYR